MSNIYLTLGFYPGWKGRGSGSNGTGRSVKPIPLYRSVITIVVA
jgi:hypothetical protein